MVATTAAAMLLVDRGLFDLDDLGLLGGDDLTGDLGMSGGFADFEADLASLEEIGLGNDPGFAEELAELDVADE